MTSVAREDPPVEGIQVPQGVGAESPGMPPKEFASMDDVLAEGVAIRGGISAFGDPNQQQLERIWGPVLEEDAKACGAPYGAASVLLRVAVDPVVLARFRALIPDHVKSQPGDTKEILKKRLGGSDWLDVIYFKWKGHGGGGRTTELNRTAMCQARRVTWSVMLGAATLFEGASVQVSSRPPTCTPTRRPHFFPPTLLLLISGALCLHPVRTQGQGLPLQTDALGLVQLWLGTMEAGVSLPRGCQSPTSSYFLPSDAMCACPPLHTHWPHRMNYLN